jgi:uncharacterized phiE125 gp8 family phage protein
MTLTMVTGPAALPITEAEVWDHLRVGDDPPDQADILRKIKAAVSSLDGKDGYLGRCLIHQTWRLTLDRFPRDGIRLPLLPVVSVVVTYTDTDDTEQTLTGYHLKAGDVGVILPGDEGMPKLGPTYDGVMVDFVAGYGTEPDAVPEPIRQAICRAVSESYDNRETWTDGRVSLLPGAFDGLDLYRVGGWVW